MEPGDRGWRLAEEPGDRGWSPGTGGGAVPRSLEAESGARGPGVEPGGRGWSPGAEGGAVSRSPVTEGGARGPGLEPGAGGGAMTQSPGAGAPAGASSQGSDRSTQARFSRDCAAAAASWAPGSALRL